MTPLELVLSRATDVRREGRSHRALCPVHGGHSLVVDENRDGDALVRCMGGCATDAVLASLGVAARDLFARSGPDRTRDPATSCTGPDRATLNELADYHCETVRRLPAHAELLDRFGLDVDDAVELGLGYDPGPSAAITRPACLGPAFRTARLIVPFRNPAGELVALQGRAIDPNASQRWAMPAGSGWAQAAWFHRWGDGPVVITEGPSDALTVLAAGRPAVAVRGAALHSDALADELAAGLTGRPVLVAGDNDPAGHTWAAELAPKLAARGLEVRLVTAPGDGSDLTDHVHAGGDLDALLDKALAGPALPVPADTGSIGDAVGHPHTDLGNARQLVDEHGAELRHAPQLGQWLAWDGARWAEDLTGEVHRRAKATVDRLHTRAADVPDSREREALTRHWIRSQAAARLAAMVHLAATEPGVPVTIDDLDPDPWALNVRNGVVDLHSGELRPHDRNAMHTRLAPVAYDPNVDAPTWRRFLLEVFGGDDELVAFVQRFAGYSLTGSVAEQCLVFCYGTGANGKSTLLNTLRLVLGDYAHQLDPAVLTVGQHEQHPTALTDLRGARFVSTIETEHGRRLAEALVKQLTGGDPITARRMRQDFFTFMPTHKLWFAGNHLPRVRGTDVGIWRRIHLLPFEQAFTGDRRDPHLGARLEAEAAGVLAWAVEGCLQWQATGLQVPARVRSATDLFRAGEDHVGRFLADVCELDDTRSIPAKALRDAYETWCRDNGEQVWTMKALGAELTARGFDRAQQGRSKTWTWIGLDTVAGGVTDAA